MLLVDDLAAGGTKNLRHTPRGLVTLVMLGNYSQQTTSADDIFKCILRVNRRVDKFTPRVQSDHRSGYSI